MHAPPFEDERTANAEFRNHLQKIFRENSTTAALIDSDGAADH